jgi:hypothetical protein
MLQNASKNDVILHQKYFCKRCDFRCSKKGDMSRHLSTRKHTNASKMLPEALKNDVILHHYIDEAYDGKIEENITLINVTKPETDVKLHHYINEVYNEKLGKNNTLTNVGYNTTDVILHHYINEKDEKHVDTDVVYDVDKNISDNPYIKTPTTSFKCICGTKYKHRQSLTRHIRTCLCFQKQLDNKDTTGSSIINTNNDKNSLDKEFLTTLISSMTKFNVDNQETILKILKEIIPNVGVNNSVNTNSINNINNHFNIQMFLNDKCKNAMNLTDFIESLPITSATYDNTIENGLTKTITNMFVDGLNNMDILERPIHCTDPARKTLYIKDNNVWEKNNKLNAIENSITKIANKQRTMISKWQEVNIGWKNNDNLQTKLTSLVCNSMTLIEQDEKETNKIIRAISKNTHLTQYIKDEYK